MAKKWSEIYNGETYQSASPEEQEAVRKDYFDKIIAPKVKQAGDNVDAVWSDFQSKYPSKSKTPSQPTSNTLLFDIGPDISKTINPINAINTGLDYTKKTFQEAARKGLEINESLPYHMKLPNMVLTSLSAVIGEIFPDSTNDIGEIILTGGIDAINRRGVEGASFLANKVKKVLPAIYNKVKSVGAKSTEEVEPIIIEELSKVLRSEDIAKITKESPEIASKLIKEDTSKLLKKEELNYPLKDKLANKIANSPPERRIGAGKLTPKEQEASLKEFYGRRQTDIPQRTPQEKIDLNARAIEKENLANKIIEENKGLPRDEIDKKVYQALDEYDLINNKNPKGPYYGDDLEKFMDVNSAESLGDFNKIEVPKFAGNINLDKMNISDDAKVFAKQVWDETSGVISNREVIERAKDAKILDKVITDETQKDILARVKATESHAAAILERDFKNNTITKEGLETLKIVSSEKSFSGRMLQANKIAVNPVLDDPRTKMMKKLAESGIDLDEIVKAGEKVDWNNAKEVTDFYRKFIKPTKGEILRAYRYGNMLSGILTTSRNVTTGLSEALIVNPMKMTFNATQDMFKNMGQKLMGKEVPREYLYRDIPAYFKGFVGSLGDSSKKALNVISGKAMVTKPDLKYLPTGSKMAAPGEAVMRFLEAQDIFIRNSIAQGEMAAMIKKGISPEKAAIEAADKAERMLFRGKLDPQNVTGQGRLMSLIDKGTNAVNQLRHGPGEWAIPFLNTPMNIFKIGVKRTPLGLFNLKGNVNKIDAVSDMLVGSLVMGVAAEKALEGKITGPLPKNQKARDYWEMRGIKPWSMKIGDNWYQLSNIGPLGYPFALVAAVQEGFQNSPTSKIDTLPQKSLNSLAVMGRFFSDQSYMKALGDVTNMMDSEKAGASVATNFAQQLVFMNGLRTWAGRFNNEYQKKNVNELTPEALFNNLIKDDPFFSKYAMPKTNILMQPVENKYRIFNAFSPVSKSREDEKWGKIYNIQTQIADKERASGNVIKKETKKDVIRKVGDR